MKTNVLPWLLLTAGVVGGIVYLGQAKPAAAPATGPGPNPPPLGPATAPPGPVTTTAPGLPSPSSPSTLTAEQSATIATLLDSRVRAPSVMLDQWAAVAAGPDSKQNADLVSRLRMKAFFMREEELRGRPV